MTDYIRLQKVSELTGLKISYLRNLVNRNEIPSYKQGKFVVFRPEEVEQWMKDRTIKK